MLMFKYSLGLVPIPIKNCLLKITSVIITIQGRVDHFTLLWGGVKRSTEQSHFMESILGINYQNIYPLM